MPEGVIISILATNADIITILIAVTEMFTEDDTFRALSRASVPEMLKHYDDWVKK